MNSQRNFITSLLVALVPTALCSMNCFADPATHAASEQTVGAGPIEATLKLDRSSLNVAESLIATLTVKAATGVRVSLPPVEKQLGEFSIASAVDEPLRTVATSRGEEQLFVRRYTLEPFLSGDYTFPSLEIRWQKSASESGVARTAEVKVNVESLLAKQTVGNVKELDPGTIRDAYTSPAVRGTGPVVIAMAIGFGAATFIGGGLWVWSRRRRATDEIATLLERVEHLRRESGSGQPNPESLHHLAGVLRCALADRVDPDAEATETRELVRRLEKIEAWGESDARRVGDVLTALDAARFGGGPMSPSEFGRHVEAVLAMLSKMRALPKPGVRR